MWKGNNIWFSFYIRNKLAWMKICNCMSLNQWWCKPDEACVPTKYVMWKSLWYSKKHFVMFVIIRNLCCNEWFVINTNHRNHLMWCIVCGKQKPLEVLRIVMVTNKLMQKPIGVMVMGHPKKNRDVVMGNPKKTQDVDRSWCRESEIIYIH